MYAGNWNILVPAGKENNSDSLISSERKGKRANWISFRKEGRDVVELKPNLSKRSFLERNALEGDSPVFEDNMACSKRVGFPR